MQFHASEEGLAATDAALDLIDSPSPVPGVRTDVPDLRGGAVLRVTDVSVTQPGRDLVAPCGGVVQRGSR